MFLCGTPKRYIIPAAGGPVFHLGPEYLNLLLFIKIVNFSLISVICSPISVIYSPNSVTLNQFLLNFSQIL
jgi:hypothetical protein